ncbi:MAG: arabinose operon transcriptional regulator AraC [Planctomycetota bacterium]|jgi:AraC family transcriptional regulator of arabinose operon
MTTMTDYARPSADRTRMSLKGGKKPVLRPHGMVGWVLNATVLGRGVIGRGDECFSVAPGDLLLFPPGVPHSYTFDEEAGEWEHLWVYFTPPPALEPLLTWPEAGNGALKLTTADPSRWNYLVARLETLIEVANRYAPHRERLVHTILEEILLWCSEYNPDSDEGRMDERILKAIDFMTGNMGRPVVIEELATLSSLSSSRFSHLFKEETGLSPLQYMEEFRLQRASKLLAMTTKPVTQIGIEVGFHSVYYFSRRFKRSFGLSPRAFRERHQSGTAATSGG